MNWKRLISLDSPDKVGLVATTGLLLFVTMNNLITLNEIASHDSTQAAVLFIIGLYLLTNTLANMTRAALTDTTINSIQLQIKQLPEWRYCAACEQYAPPRAYHCHTCDKCILKRHNHCLFLGKCVGHNNLRFYIVFILYVFLGAVYSTYLNWAHFVRMYGELSLKSFFITIMPMFAWAFGMVTTAEFFFTFINTIALIVSLIMLIYFFINLRMVLNGQTWNESAKNVRTYALGWRHNLVEALGTNWLASLLNAFASLRLPGDGTSFRKSDLFQHDSTTVNAMNADGYLAANYGMSQNFNPNLQQRRII
jgi:palmitoyltransferase